MKKFATGFCGALMLAGLAVPALAAPPAKSAPAKTTMSSGSNFGSVISEGQLEAGGNISWFKTDVADVGIVSLNGGYMFTDNLEFKLNWTGILGDASGGLLAPGVDWFFTNLDLPVIPYVGGAFGLAYGDFDDLSSIDLHAGVKQFLTERVALDYQLRYLQPTDSDFDSFQIMTIGFTVYL